MGAEDRFKLHYIQPGWVEIQFRLGHSLRVWDCCSHACTAYGYTHAGAPDCYIRTADIYAYGDIDTYSHADTYPDAYGD